MPNKKDISDKKKAERDENHLINILGLIAIPAASALLVVYQTISSISDRQHQIMSQYLEQMTQLLTDGDLNSKSPHPRTVGAARAITIHAALQLNGERRGQLLRFLYESELIGKCKFDQKTLQPIECDKVPLVNISSAKLGGIFDKEGRKWFLQGAILNDVSLKGANLQDVSLGQASMQRANLENANLSRALLEHANLFQAKLNSAILSGAILQEANLRNAEFSGADFSCTVDVQGKERCADLSNAKLNSQTDFTRANFRGAILDTPFLSEANLGSAVYDDKTTFPDGFDEFKRDKKGMIKAVASNNQSATFNPASAPNLLQCRYASSYCLPIKKQ